MPRYKSLEKLANPKLRKIGALRAKGLTNSAIAKRLKIPSGTVAVYAAQLVKDNYIRGRRPGKV